MWLKTTETSLCCIAASPFLSGLLEVYTSCIIPQTCFVLRWDNTDLRDTHLQLKVPITISVRSKPHEIDQPAARAWTSSLALSETAS